MASSRIWSTIHDSKSARQAVETGVGGAFTLAAICLAMAVQGFLSKRSGLEVMCAFAVLYAGAGSRARVKPSGRACDLGFFALAMLFPIWWREPALHLHDFWGSFLPPMVFITGFSLLNGARGSSFLAEFPE